MSNIIQFPARPIKPSAGDYMRINWLLLMAWFAVSVQVMRLLWQAGHKRPALPANDQRNVYAGDPFIQ